MKCGIFRGFGVSGGSRLRFSLVMGLFGAVLAARADLIEMQNGDRYVGHVVSLDADKLVLQSEVLGTVNLPRQQVAQVSFGKKAGADLGRGAQLTNPRPVPTALVITNPGPPASRLAGQLRANTNLIQQIESQFLSAAAPEAKDKFNELMGGLMSGKLDVADIRKEAAAAAEQIRTLKKDLGNDAGWSLDAYLAVLDRFVKETAPPATARTNAPAHRAE